ncbi:MAG: hypothetical protein ACU0DW_08500 [Shimia sp.]
MSILLLEGTRRSNAELIGEAIQKLRNLISRMKHRNYEREKIDELRVTLAYALSNLTRYTNNPDYAEEAISQGYAHIAPSSAVSKDILANDEAVAQVLLGRLTRDIETLQRATDLLAASVYANGQAN